MCCCTVGTLSFSVALLLAWGSRRASKRLHQGMLVTTFRLPLAFFDTTPMGRVINRFSKDVDVIDAVLAVTLSMWLVCLLQVVATVLVIGMSMPLFLLVVLPLSGGYFLIQVLSSGTALEKASEL